MQFKRFSLQAFALGLSACALTSCASQPLSYEAQKKKPTSSRRVVRKTKLRDPVVRAEIQDELIHLNSDENQIRDFATEPLKGPITMARLAQIELELKMAESKTQPISERLAQLKGGVLDSLLTQNGMAAAKAAVVAKAAVEKAESTVHDDAAEKLKALIAAGPATTRVVANSQGAAVVMHEPGKGIVTITEPAEPPVALKTLRSLESSKMELSASNETPFIFDIPVTYNERVSSWIHYFQTSGRRSFRTWLERSARYLPVVEAELQRAGLPQDLVYVAMIESGFKPDAVSHAGAMGMWQFISSTGRRYGLSVDWWIDERRDFAKSTQAAIAYMKDLNSQFNSWYLVAASYNMGENGVRKLMKRHNTNDFWTLANRRALPRETTDYVPKIIAATLIAKAPALYGFRDLEYQAPLSFEMFTVPGGTDLINLASFLGVSGKYIQELNPELTRGFVPRDVKGHNIRIPKGSGLVVSQFVRLQQAAPFRESAQNDLK